MESQKKSEEKDKLGFFFLLSGRSDEQGTVLDPQYVHSKIIVADEIAHVGSANINDRSLLQDRDAEIGVTIDEPDSAKALLHKAIDRHVANSCEVMGITRGELFEAKGIT